MQVNRAQRRHPVTLPSQRKAAPIIGALLQRFYDNNAFDIYMASGMLIDPQDRDDPRNMIEFPDIPDFDLF